jgi:xanthine/uracil permease
MKRRTTGAVILASALIFFNSSTFSQNIGLVDVRRSEQIITVGGAGADIPGFSSEQFRLLSTPLKAEVEEQ